MATETWIEEFLYRGRPSTGVGSSMESTFQITVMKRAPDPFGDGNPVTKSTVLTAAQAEAEGFSLASLVAGVNTDALKSVDDARTERDRALEAKDVATGRAEDAERRATAAETQAAALASELQATRDVAARLEADLMAARAAVAPPA